MSGKKIIVFDIDGTISDCEHRKHYIEKDDWEGFYDACHMDELKEPIAFLWKAIELSISSVNHRVEIFTGRPERLRQKTIHWLSSHGLTFDNMRMRADGDFTPDHEIKKQWAKDVGPENILMVFEDRDRNVKMFRELGITCLQVAPGNF